MTNSKCVIQPLAPTTPTVGSHYTRVFGPTRKSPTWPKHPYVACIVLLLPTKPMSDRAWTGTQVLVPILQRPWHHLLSPPFVLPYLFGDKDLISQYRVAPKKTAQSKSHLGIKIPAVRRLDLYASSNPLFIALIPHVQAKQSI